MVDYNFESIVEDMTYSKVSENIVYWACFFKEIFILHLKK